MDRLVGPYERLYLAVHPRPFEQIVGWLSAWVDWRVGRRLGLPADEQLDRRSRRGWPVGARLIDWTADRLDDLGLWISVRRAVRWAATERAGKP